MTQESGEQRNVVVQEDRMDHEIENVLDDGNTVGTGSVEPGDGTVVFDDARQAFAHVRKRRGDWEIGDDDSHIFLSSEGGELEVGFGPQFAPIETAIKQWQYRTAVAQLEGHYPDFELLFDKAGLVAFRGEETTAIVAPTQFPWDKPSPDCGPRTPGGPTA